VGGNPTISFCFVLFFLSLLLRTGYRWIQMFICFIFIIPLEQSVSDPRVIHFDAKQAFLYVMPFALLPLVFQFIYLIRCKQYV